MKISVIIPVYNEETLINSTIASLGLLSRGYPYETIVVDGAAGEGTLKAITDTSVKKMRSAPGRGRQMNAGAAGASGDVVLFLHADTGLPQDWFSKIKEALADENIAGGAFRLAIGSKSLFLRLIAFTANLRTLLFRTPYGDQAIFFRKRYFEELGGFKEIPVMEDVEIMRRVRRRGDRIAVLDAAVTTSARRWENEGALRATLRNKALKLMYYLGVPPDKLAGYYQRTQ